MNLPITQSTSYTLRPSMPPDYKDKLNLYMKEYRQQHKDSIIDAQKRYREAHKKQRASTKKKMRILKKILLQNKRYTTPQDRRAKGKRKRIS